MESELQTAERLVDRLVRKNDRMARKERTLVRNQLYRAVGALILML